MNCETGSRNSRKELESAQAGLEGWSDEDGRPLNADQVREQIRSLQEDLDTRTDELVRQEAHFVDRLAKVEASEAEIESAHAASDLRAEELNRQQAEIDERTQALLQLEEEYERRDESLREREQNLERDEVALEEQGNLLAEREKEVGERHLEVMQWKREFESQASVEAEAGADNAADADLEVRRLQSDLNEIEVELDSARQTLAQREDELSEVRAALEQSQSGRSNAEGPAGDARDAKNRILAEFADRQDSLARREAELNRRESELTRRELLISDAGNNANSTEATTKDAEEQSHADVGEIDSGPKESSRIIVTDGFSARDASPSASLDVRAAEPIRRDTAETAAAQKRLAEYRSSVYEQRFGPCDEYLPDDDTKMPIDVSVHLPGGSRDFATMVTNGMSDYAIPMPNGQRSVRAELILYVTHVDELAIKLMRSAAKIPYRKKQGLSIGTTGELGDENLLRSCNQKDCVYMLPVVEADSKPIPAKEYLGSSIQLFWLVTITTAERRLIDSHGIHRFLSLLEKNNHAVFFDMTRECYAKRRSWFRR